MLNNFENLIKEDTPKTSHDMMKRSLVDGVHALLIYVSNTTKLARLSGEVLAFVAERIDEMRKNLEVRLYISTYFFKLFSFI